MERIQNVNEEELAQRTSEYMAQDTDQDLPPEDRRTRTTDMTLATEHRAVCYGSRLKVGDHVSMNGFEVVVACAARDRHYFGAYTPVVPFLLGCAAAEVTDRAPLDPQEEPMPVMLDDPEEP